MVALLVIGFIVVCLAADLLVIHARKRREQGATVQSPAAMAPALVFAQDGGLPVDESKSSEVSAKEENNTTEEVPNDEGPVD